jgi:hypothetical protein
LAGRLAQQQQKRQQDQLHLCAPTGKCDCHSLRSLLQPRLCPFTHMPSPLRHTCALIAGPIVSAVVRLLFGPPEGLSSALPGDREAASRALGSCLAAAPVEAHEALLPLLEGLLDRWGCAGG